MMLWIYPVAAVAEIAGCFAFWAWLRLDKSAIWLLPGAVSLGLFAYLLTLSQEGFAGRAYALYGAVYIVTSLVWMWLVEGQKPDDWDIMGACVCIAGAALMLLGPRT